MRAKICLFLLSMANVIAGAESLSILDPILQAIFGPPPLPEEKMTVPEIITYHGYPVEIHSVTTKDGYILNMHRIPHGKDDTTSGKRQPVLVVHGLLCDSVVWVWNNPEANFAYVLAEAGYDVWLANFRGTKYSQNHTTLATNSKEYWDFSWDQMAEFDLPAKIDYILKVTGFTQIFYAGHSMGVTTIFALLSTQLEYNEKVKVVAALAPPITVGYMISPVRLLSVAEGPLFALISLQQNGKFDINSGVSNFLLTAACNVPAVSIAACSNILFAIGGPDYPQLNQSRVSLYFNKYPTTTSVHAVQHFIQETKSKKFCRFDFGKTKNQEKYNQETPPEYNISQITAPIAIYWGENDWLATPRDVALIPPKLQNMVLFHKVNWTQFSHNDFMIAIDVKELVYDPVVDLFNEYK